MSPQPQTITMTRHDDMHLHVRDGQMLETVLPHTARQFARALIMPNLRPPVTTAEQAVVYRQRILQALPPGADFTPLMSLYLTDNTSAQEVILAKQAGVVAFKPYPAGATTNSDAGVTDIRKPMRLCKPCKNTGCYCSFMEKSQTLRSIFSTAKPSSLSESLSH